MLRRIFIILSTFVLLGKAHHAIAFDGVNTDYKQQYNAKVVARLGKQLQETIDYNQSHQHKKYFIQDGDALPYFYHYFSSKAAANLISPDLQITGNSADDGMAINDYINVLRTKYLPAKYKDYQIYFMVAGMYYVPDISQTDVSKNLDWTKVRSLSFDNIPATSTPTPYVRDNTKRQNVMEAFKSDVNQGIYHKLLKDLGVKMSLTEKTIIFYKWLLFDIDIKNETLESYLETGAIDNASWTSTAEPVMFMSSGYFTKKNATASTEFLGLNGFLQSDKDYSDIISVDNMPYQRNKLMKDVTNAFVYFYQRDNSLIPSNFCDLDNTGKNKALDVIAASYKNAPTGRWEDAPFRNPILFQNITWETRKCIFDYLLSKQYCSDSKGLIAGNACEDMLVDAIGAARNATVDDQKKVLDYFSDPAIYYKAYSQVDDAGGQDNYTALVLALNSLAVKNDYSKSYAGEIPIFKIGLTQDKSNPWLVSIATKSLDVKSNVNDKGISLTFSQTEAYGSSLEPRISTSNIGTYSDIPPFADIQVIVTKEIQPYLQLMDGQSPALGSIVNVKAMLFQNQLINRGKQSALTSTVGAAQSALLTVSLFTGVGELYTATTWAGRIWAAGDVLFTASAIAADAEPIADYIQKKYGDKGTKTLAFINECGTIFAGVYVTRGILTNLSSKLTPEIEEGLEALSKDEQFAKVYAKEKSEIDEVLAAAGKKEATLEELFAGARQSAISKFGKDAENLIYLKFNKDGGAAAEIIDHYGLDGLNALKKVDNIQDAVNELVQGKTAYRHISSTVSYLDKMKSTGKIPAQTGRGTTYFSLDKFDDPLIAIDRMQLNAKGTDAVWRVEFDATQLVNKAQFPMGKWNNADYIEVLTRSYPNFGSGGASQFITQSEIQVTRLINLKTGEIINFK